MQTLTAIVEIPRGSRSKYEIDKKTGRLFLDRIVSTAFGYPTNYGFIENTLALDGDPIDALILVQNQLFPGVALHIRPVGVLHMTDDGGEDDKVLCVALKDPYCDHINDLDDVPKHVLNQIEHFFQHYKDLEEGKWVKLGTWNGKDKAIEIITEGLSRFN